MIFEELAAREPRLKTLRDMAELLQLGTNSPAYDPTLVWYRAFKPVLVRLVGFCRHDDPVLGTCEAYDLAYKTINDTLPDRKRPASGEAMRLDRVPNSALGRIPGRPGADA